MYSLTVALHVIVCLILIVIVLLHGSKNGGLGNTFGGGGGGQSLFGVTGPASFLSKLVAGAAGIFMVTSLVLSMISYRSLVTTGITEELDAGKPVTKQESPVSAPATSSQPGEQKTSSNPESNSPAKSESANTSPVSK